MKFFYLVFFLSLFAASSVFAASGERKTYLSVYYGVAKSSSTSSILDSVNGKAMGGALGFQLGRHFALELTGRKTTYDEKSSSTDFPVLGAVTSSSKTDALFLGIGFRLFFLKILNVMAGAGYSSIDPKFSISLAGTSVGSVSKATGLGYYYGGGVQIPLGAIDIYGDYVINTYSSDTKGTEMVGGLRIRF